METKKILNMTLHKLKLAEECKGANIVEPSTEDKKILLVDFNKLEDDEYMNGLLMSIAKIIKKYDGIDAVYVAGAVPVVIATCIVAETYGIKPVGGIINDKKEVVSVYPIPTYSSIPRKVRLEIEHL